MYFQTAINSRSQKQVFILVKIAANGFGKQNSSLPIHTSFVCSRAKHARLPFLTTFKHRSTIYLLTDVRQLKEKSSLHHTFTNKRPINPRFLQFGRYRNGSHFFQSIKLSQTSDWTKNKSTQKSGVLDPPASFSLPVIGVFQSGALT